MRLLSGHIVLESGLVGWRSVEGYINERERDRGMATVVMLVIVTPSFDRGDEENKKGGTRKQRMGELTS